MTASVKVEGPNVRQPVLGMLRDRYPTRTHAIFAEVRNGAGFSASRSCDALVMSLWPSHGMELYGIEIKNSRSDWLRELKQPEKSDEFMAVCDRWWLAVGDRDIATVDEMPATWGLLVPRGGRLVVAKQAPKLMPIPLDRGTLASLLKRAQSSSVDETTLAAKYAEGVQRGREATKWENKDSARELERLRESVKRFEGASGLRLDEYSADNKALGEAVRAIVHHGPGSYARHLRGIAHALEGEIENARKGAEAMEALEAQT